MDNSLDNHSTIIKKFVRHVLGCTCPDRVFEQIEDRTVPPSASPHTRSITVGNRLLIYIWKADASVDLRQGISAMLAAGKKDREARGLNRFRGVLAVEDPQTIQLQADLCFSQFEGCDDRMHIHVVPVDELKDF
jgi:hypothetical protein